MIASSRSKISLLVRGPDSPCDVPFRIDASGPGELDESSSDHGKAYLAYMYRYETSTGGFGIDLASSGSPRMHIVGWGDREPCKFVKMMMVRAGASPSVQEE